MQRIALSGAYFPSNSFGKRLENTSPDMQPCIHAPTLLKWRAQQALNTSLSVGGVGACMHGCMSGDVFSSRFPKELDGKYAPDSAIRCMTSWLWRLFKGE